jgi:hypothetical protein
VVRNGQRKLRPEEFVEEKHAMTNVSSASRGEHRLIKIIE